VEDTALSLAGREQHPYISAMMLRRSFLVAAAALSAFPALAQVQRRLSADDESDVKRVEAYLNAIRTFKARFLQIDSNGFASEGVFYLSRPGRLRLDYDAPNPNLLIANGSFLIHYDRQLKTPAYLSLDSTPAGLLVRDPVALSGDVTVTGVERGPAVLRLSLVQTRDPRAGRVTFVFTERPFTLSNWQVTDAQGLTTRISLSEANAGLPLDPQLFVFRDPATFGEGATR
jgi:outer membrane lipoprotein-sorting protein